MSHNERLCHKDFSNTSYLLGNSSSTVDWANSSWNNIRWFGSNANNFTFHRSKENISRTCCLSHFSKLQKIFKLIWSTKLLWIIFIWIFWYQLVRWKMLESNLPYNFPVRILKTLKLRLFLSFAYSIHYCRRLSRCRNVLFPVSGLQSWFRTDVTVPTKQPLQANQAVKSFREFHFQQASTGQRKCSGRRRPGEAWFWDNFVFDNFSFLCFSFISWRATP